MPWCWLIEALTWFVLLQWFVFIFELFKDSCDIFLEALLLVFMISVLSGSLRMTLDCTGLFYRPLFLGYPLNVHRF